MYHFFVTNDQVFGQQIVIKGSDVNHICNVLRMQPGEELEISDGTGREYVCAIREMSEDDIWLDILQKRNSVSELSSRITLIQGLPKGDKMELIVQKAVELGVYEIVPAQMKRCVVKLDAKKAEKKQERWNGIAESAAKQSKRAMIPQVTDVMTFSEAVAYAAKSDVLLVPYECADNMQQTRELIEGIEPGQSVAVWIGPEGGFEEAEVEKIIEQGGKSITLGHRILRTETAGLTALSILMYHLEN